MSFTWVTKAAPCPICSKPDWCQVSLDGKIAICRRIPSERPSNNAMGGWVHRLDCSKKTAPAPIVRKSAPSRDFLALWHRWLEKTTENHFKSAAFSLSLPVEAMQDVGFVWVPEHQAWAIPMRDASDDVIGIRFRSATGKKWALTGSKAGLFVPNRKWTSSMPFFVVEGPTDTAAAHALGLQAIGRPSCLGQETLVASTLNALGATRVVIVADNDSHGAGLRGAKVLRSALRQPRCIILLPTKDMRDFLSAGGTKEVVFSLVNQAVWKK